MWWFLSHIFQNFIFGWIQSNKTKKWRSIGVFTLSFLPNFSYSNLIYYILLISSVTFTSNQKKKWRLGIVLSRQPPSHVLTIISCLLHEVLPAQKWSKSSHTSICTAICHPIFLHFSCLFLWAKRLDKSDF